MNFRELYGTDHVDYNPLDMIVARMEDGDL